MSFRVHVMLGRIFSQVDVEPDVSIPDLRGILFGLLGDITNTVCFLQVFGLSYEIDSITPLATGESQLMPADGYVYADEDENDPRFSFRRVREGEAYQFPYQMLGDRHFTRAAFELRNAIRYTHYTARHCRLAIEAIRNAFPGANREAQWAALREILRVSRDSIDSFAPAANAQRHGDNVDQTWSQRQHAMQIAWEIVNRYRLSVTGDAHLGSLPEL